MENIVEEECGPVRWRVQGTNEGAINSFHLLQGFHLYVTGFYFLFSFKAKLEKENENISADSAALKCSNKILQRIRLSVLQLQDDPVSNQDAAAH